jgi:hypothetical protein
MMDNELQAVAGVELSPTWNTCMMESSAGELLLHVLTNAVVKPFGWTKLNQMAPLPF